MKKRVVKLNEDQLEGLVKRIIKEAHEDTDEGKMKYIKGALKNLNSKDLDKIYKSVEDCDPNYEG
tara:strand:- start:587 stop:781 length:195 start_codon:yes stop_codon:yes gene_type:complete